MGRLSAVLRGIEGGGLLFSSSVTARTRWLARRCRYPGTGNSPAARQNRRYGAIAGAEVSAQGRRGRRRHRGLRFDLGIRECFQRELHTVRRAPVIG